MWPFGRRRQVGAEDGHRIGRSNCGIENCAEQRGVYRSCSGLCRSTAGTAALPSPPVGGAATVGKVDQAAGSSRREEGFA